MEHTKKRNSWDKIWSQKELDWLRENFGKLKGPECARIIGVSEATIYNLRDRDFKVMDGRWLQEELDILKGEYHNLGSFELSKVLTRFTPRQIRVKASKFKLTVSSDVRNNIYQTIGRTWMITEEYQSMANDFINVASPEHAYLLGFLWADGYITPNSNRISCRIQKQDGLALRDIFMKTGDWNIQFLKSRERCGEAIWFDISNSILHSFLTENDYKSKSIESACKILSKIPDNLKHYWFRGLLDGDGCVSKLHYVITISSSYSQKWNFMENLCNYLDIPYAIITRESFNKKSNKINRYSAFNIIRAEGVLKFGSFIYSGNCSIGLKRKRLLAFNKFQKTQNHKYSYIKELSDIYDLSKILD